MRILSAIIIFTLFTQCNQIQAQDNKYRKFSVALAFGLSGVVTGVDGIKKLVTDNRWLMGSIKIIGGIFLIANAEGLGSLIEKIIKNCSTE